MLNTTNVQLDLYSRQNYVYIQAQQYDQNSRYIALAITDSGKPYTIPQNTKAIIVMNKPDNTSVINDCSITNNMVMIELTQQMLMSSGLGTARVTLLDNNTNAALSSVDFYVRIQPCPVGQSVIASSNEYQTFIDALNRLDSIIADGSQLIVDVDVLKKDLEIIKEETLQLIIDTTTAKDEAIEATNDAIDATNTANEEEQKRQDNETIRTNSEDIRISSEETRMSNESERESAESARNTSENNRVSVEADRVLEESNRSTAEANRVLIENNRVTAESDRVIAETKRDTEENTRITNEVTRQSNETVRDTAEQIRVANENTRGTKESERIKSESDRAKAETTRDTNETIRINTETARKTAETTRDTTEQERVAKETQRILSESNREATEVNRVQSETTRTTAETTREANEIKRNTAEEKRQTDTTAAIENTDKATDRANIAAEACEGIIDGTGLISSTEKGRASGVATLDNNAKLPSSQLTDHSHTFTTVTEKPTTLVGYGITDALNKSETTFTPATTRTNIASGETLKTILGKINKWFGDHKALAFKDKVAVGDLESDLVSHNLTTNNPNMVLGADQGVAIQEKFTALDDKKVDAIIGKGLSTNDYTTLEKTKLSKIADSANNYIHPSAHPATMITTDATHRFTTDAEKESFTDLQAYTGYVSDEIVGVEVDFKANNFIRLAGAVGKHEGEDFNTINAFGGRKRCNLTDGGVVTAYYGDKDYTETGSIENEITIKGTVYPIGTHVQVMVEQPRFYYKVVPILLEKIEDGKGFHGRKMRYYISDTQREGFKLHPAFISGGAEKQNIYLSAYEGSLWDASENTYIKDDKQVADFTTDMLSSIAEVKPISCEFNTLTVGNTRKLANKRGAGWQLQSGQTVSATQILFLVEYASFNMQEKIGVGVTTKPADQEITIENTGSTNILGNITGSVTNKNDFNVISYRGEENFFGNMWKFIDGLHVYAYGINDIYVADNNFTDNKITENYKNAGITLAKKHGFVSAFGYNEPYDWLFFASETAGTNMLPVSDYFHQASDYASGILTSLLGGVGVSGLDAGGFYWNTLATSGTLNLDIGGRLSYIPNANESDKIGIGDLEDNLISHNLVTTNPQMLLGADQGPVIQNQLTQLNDNLGNCYKISFIANFNSVLEWAKSCPNTFSPYAGAPLSDKHPAISWGHFWCIGNDMFSTGTTVFARNHTDNKTFTRTISNGAWSSPWSTVVLSDDFKIDRLIGLGINDLNEVTVSGIYRFEAEELNRPFNSAYNPFLVIHPSESDTIAQIVVGYSNADMFVRSGRGAIANNPAIWTEWRKVMYDDNTPKLYTTAVDPKGNNYVDIDMPVTDKVLLNGRVIVTNGDYGVAGVSVLGVGLVDNKLRVFLSGYRHGSIRLNISYSPNSNTI